MNDSVIRRKHVGSHRREQLALRGRLRRKGDARRGKGNARMRREGGKKRKEIARRMKGDVRMRREGGSKKKGNGPMRRHRMRRSRGRMQ